MAEDIVVVGAGGFGRETLDVISSINARASRPPWRVAGVVDDRPAPENLERLRTLGVAHLGGVDVLLSPRQPARWFVVGIGSPHVRAELSAKIRDAGGRAATLVHPSAVIGSQFRAGPGTVICGGVQVSTNVMLGEHVHLNPGAIIGHDTVLRDFVSVNPGATISGEVEIGPASLVGAGAVILQGLAVGSESVVGASACVTRSVADHVVVKGVPARAGAAARESMKMESQ